MIDDFVQIMYGPPPPDPLTSIWPNLFLLVTFPLVVIVGLIIYFKKKKKDKKKK